VVDSRRGEDLRRRRGKRGKRTPSDLTEGQSEHWWANYLQGLFFSPKDFKEVGFTTDLITKVTNRGRKRKQISQERQIR